jgi:hypothetical protein
MMLELPEPWLRGPLAGASPLVAPVLRSFEQAREDLEKYTQGLTTEQIWSRPANLAPVGFQLRHIAGSVDRLMTYLLGKQLDESQMAALAKEMEPGESRESLLLRVNEALNAAGAEILRIDPSKLTEPRVVGRKRLPTTVVGLMIHIAEHTQRHVGQAITTAKFVRSYANS